MRNVLIAIVLVACGGPRSAFAPGYVGSSDARRAGMMSGEDDLGHPALLRDEAVLSHQDASGVCFDVTVRSSVADDAPFADRELTCASAQVAGEATVNSERVSVYDYDQDGHVDNVVTEDITASAFASFEHDPADDGVLRVVERSARLCCTVSSSTEVTLRIVAEQGALELRWRD